MRRVFCAAAFLSLSFWLISCGPEPTRVVDLEGIELTGEIIEFDSLLTVQDLVKYEGEFYALDNKAGQVLVYSEDGKLLRSFGQLGEGPGELSNPMSLAVGGGRVYVCSRGGLVTVFSTDGLYVERLPQTGLMHINSNFGLVNDSHIFVGGAPQNSGERFREELGHLFTKEGEAVADFMPTSENAEKYQTGVVNGGYCDSDEEGQLWCSQPMDYDVRVFDLEGNAIKRMPIASVQFEGLREEQPEVQSSNFFEWFGSWDKTHPFYSLDPDLLLTGFTKGMSGSIWEIVDKETGAVRVSYLNAQMIWFYDKEEEALYLRMVTPEEPVTRVKKVLLRDLLAM